MVLLYLYIILSYPAFYILMKNISCRRYLIYINNILLGWDINIWLHLFIILLYPILLTPIFLYKIIKYYVSKTL